MKTRPLSIALLTLILTQTCMLRAQPAAPAAQQAVAAPAKPTLARDAAGVITLICTTPDAVICYTLDGSAPSAKSGPYLAPIALEHGGIVKARALSKDRKQLSEIAEATYEPTPGLKPISSSLVPVTQDRSWPSYDWAKRHSELCALVREHKPDVVFIGDSITHFFNADVWKQHYAPLNAANLGFGWDRTENLLWRLQHGALDGSSPKVVVVLIGTNNMQINSVPEIAAGVEAVCSDVHQRSPETRILLLGIFPRGPKPDATREKIARINELLAKLDGQNGVTFLDFGAKFLGPDGTIAKDVMGDYLHPTRKGYDVWVEAMDPTLNRLLDAKP